MTPAPAAGRGPAPVAGAYFDEVPAGAISPNPRQPRDIFDDDALAELADSIRLVGLLQPIVVRQVMPGRYEIVMGERRWRACQLAELELIPAIVRETSDTNLLRDALIENLHREQLNVLEEAAAYQQLLDDFSATHDELAQRIGRSRPHISNTIRLLKLPPAVQVRVAAGVLSAGHARALLSVDDPAAQERLAARIVAEGLSVRAVEEIVTMGTAGGPTITERRRGGRRPVAPALKDLADKLSDVFDTRVKVEMGQRKGKITVEFATVDDLERIVASMSPGITRGRGAERRSPGLRAGAPRAERDGRSGQAQRALRGRHRAEQPLEGDLDVLAPGQRGLQLQPQPGIAQMRPHRLEADRQQVVGGNDAGRPGPLEVTERLDGPDPAPGQVLGQALHEDPAQAAPGELGQHVRGHQQDGVRADRAGGEGRPTAGHTAAGRTSCARPGRRRRR